MNQYKCLSHYGPGGRNCNCCGPAPAFRVKFDRHIKRRERAEVKRKIVNELKEID